MTWTKLDDDTCVTDQPLSAFIGKRLTDNVNSYAAQLSRLSTFVFPTTAAGEPKVKFASLGSSGIAVTVDVGINALFYNFRILCQTTNASLGGTFTIHGIDDGTYVQKFFAGSATPTTVEIPFTYGTPASGLRGFHIGWASEVSEEGVGEVEIVGAVGNQVFCEPATPVQFPFTLAAGSYTEMYHVLSIDTTATGPAPAANARLAYQVCAFKHNIGADRPPHGVLVTYGDVETNPPILPTNTVGGGGGATVGPIGYIVELGRLELFSISVEVVAAQTAEIAPYAYQQPTPINAIPNRINAGMSELQPNAATSINSGGFLGCVLPAGQELTFAFFIQTNRSVQQLLVSFKAVAYNFFDAAPDITFGVRDAQGNTVGNDITHSNMPVPRLAAKTRTDRRVPGEASFMNGVLAGDELWGRRDAMNYTDVMMGLPVRFTWGPNVETEIAWGEDGSVDTVYYGTITATADLYIYGFNCKVQ
jgi:hypothetical protein